MFKLISPLCVSTSDKVTQLSDLTEPDKFNYVHIGGIIRCKFLALQAFLDMGLNTR